MEDASPKAMKVLITQAEECVKILNETLNGESFSPMLAVMLVGKLDVSTIHAWERHRLALAESWAKAAKQEEVRMPHMHAPDCKDLCAFLRSEISAFSVSEVYMSLNAPAFKGGKVTGNAPAPKRQAQSNVHNDQPAVKSQQAYLQHKAAAPQFLQCTLCDGVHSRHACDVYNDMGYRQKWNHVFENDLCQKCLRPSHEDAPCAVKRSNDACPSCKAANVTAYHNSTLCPTKYGMPASDPMQQYRRSSSENWDEN